MIDPLAPLRAWAPPTGPHHYGALALEVAEHFGVPIAEQVAQQRHVAETWRLSTEAYYAFRIFQPANFQRAHLYVSWELHQRLLQHVYREIDVAQLSDKWRFFRRASPHAAPVTAYFEDGRLVWEAESWPPGALFVKPTRLGEGEGHEVWPHYSARLMEHACARSREGPVLLQPRLENHPDNISLSPDGLATARVITCRHRAGDPSLLHALLRIPRAGSFLDHFAKGNLALPVHNGVLGAAMHVDPCHVAPDTLTGRTLAGWPEMLDACLATHRAWPDFPCIGFDVAATPDGPMILEANIYFAVNSQLICDEPWGLTRYAEVVSARLEESFPTA